MVKRKIDNRIRILIENGAAQGHRTLAVLVGDKSRDQVVFLHHMLSKSSLKQANVLWCYKKELTFSSHRRKRMKQLKARLKAGQAEINEDDPFEMFVSMTEIRYCFYKETHKILGNTYKMCVLQDFEALTPNILCRTMETVEGGGVIVILLQSITSLRQLYTLTMDVHARYRTQAHQYVVPRFNERFILSLATCPACIVMDDQLRILPLSSHLRDLQPLPPVSASTPLAPRDQELRDLKESLKDNPPVGLLVDICKTLDQAKSVLQFVVAITEKTLRTTVTLTAARGRGKSAALGIAMAGAVAFGYSNIFVTSPSPENLTTLFQFLQKGLEVMGYEEHLHYEVLRSSDPQFSKCIIRVVVTRERQQIIQYIAPGDSGSVGQAELVVIDEAAAIPLPLVQQLLGPYLVFLSSTVSGYEGTGRSLSLKLIDQLRTQAKGGQAEGKGSDLGRVLHEITLEESIRYRNGDSVESWLHHLLCLEANLLPLPPSPPPPVNCQLYYVNRDTLFGYHKVSEKFLSQVTGLLVSSHYRNTPDDLQILSDAPGHHLFVLLPPQDTTKGDTLPPVLCVVQVALEGRISQQAVTSALAQGEKPAGDLIPWTVSNQYQDDTFPQMSGARIVRIATHPDLQGKGYGSQAVKALEQYYNQAAELADYTNTPIEEARISRVVRDEQVGLLEEKLGPNPQPLPLLQALNERPPEALHYLGVSYGTTHRLLTFWKRAGFTPVYLSQVANSVTGEHTLIMLKVLGAGQDSMVKDERGPNGTWLSELWEDFRKRLVYLLAGPFKTYDCKFALAVLTNNVYKVKAQVPSLVEVEWEVSESDVQRLEAYVRNQCESSLIADIIPSLARLYFMKKIPHFKLKPVQAAVLCGVGVQRKNAAIVATELGVEKSVVMSQLYSLITAITSQMRKVRELAMAKDQEEKESDQNGDQNRVQDLTRSIKESVQKLKAKEADDREKVTQIIDVSQFPIKGQEQEVKIHSESKKKKLKLVKEEKRKKQKMA